MDREIQFFKGFERYYDLGLEHARQGEDRVTVPGCYEADYEAGYQQGLDERREKAAAAWREALKRR